MVLKSARGAQKTRNDSKRLDAYSHKWSPGDVLHVFVPIYKDEDGVWQIAVGSIWGHKVGDVKTLGLKTTFIPSLTEVDDETGQPIGQPDVTYQFSKIAKVFTQGQKRMEIAQIEKKKFPNDELKKQALADIEVKYDTKNNMQAVKPIIAPLSYLIATECACVKYVDGKPKIDTATFASLPLADQMITEIYMRMEDTKYMPDEGDEFFEYEMSYPVNPKKQDSSKSAHPSGLTPEYRMKNQFPDVYKQFQGTLNMVSRDADSIVRRATTKVAESRIRNALTQYSVINGDSLDVASETDIEVLTRNAPIIKELGILSYMENRDIIDKIQEEFAKIDAQKAEQPEIPNLVSPTQETPATPAPTPTPEAAGPTITDMPDLSAAVATSTEPAIEQPINPAAPKIQDLMNNEFKADMSDEDLMNVDLGGI